MHLALHRIWSPCQIPPWIGTQANPVREVRIKGRREMVMSHGTPHAREMEKLTCVLAWQRREELRDPVAKDSGSADVSRLECRERKRRGVQYRERGREIGNQSVERERGRATQGKGKRE